MSYKISAVKAVFPTEKILTISQIQKRNLYFDLQISNHNTGVFLKPLTLFQKLCFVRNDMLL